MKTALTCLSILLLAAAAGAYPDALSVRPANPGSGDPLVLHVDLTMPTPCYEVRNVAAYLQGGVLRVDYELYDPGLWDCIMVIAPAEFEVGHGPLPVGTWPVIVRERQIIGDLVLNEFELQAEVVVTGTLVDAPMRWSALKATYD